MTLSKTRIGCITVAMAVSLAISSLSRAAIHTIHVGNFYFTPAKTTVNQGDTVRWVLDGGVHSSTADASSPKQWDSGILASGVPFDLPFTAADGPGPFPYHCSVHPTMMKDTIFVNPPVPYICGDANNDLQITIGDAVYVINYVFRGGPAPDPLGAGDANCDANINIGDAVYIVTFIFRGGPVPCCP